MKAERDADECLFQLVLGRGPQFARVGRSAEEKSLHEPGSLRARMPRMKASMSDVFISITAFMSGR